jgi:Tetratricopeptide repeat
VPRCLILFCLLCLPSLGLKAADADTPTAQSLYDEGVKLEQGQDFEAAAAKYQEALDTDDSFTKSFRELGRCDLKLGWKDQALKNLQAYLDSGADDADVKKLVDFLQAQGGKLGALPETAEDPAGPWALEASVGYGWGGTTSNYGHNYNENNNGNSFVYSYAIGEGISYDLEALYKVNPYLSVGLAVDPMLTDTSASETLYESITQTANSTRVQSMAIPLTFNLHTHVPVGPKLELTTFAGVGAAFAQPYKETGTQVEQDSDGTFTTTSHYQRDLSDAMAFKAGLGAEYHLSDHLTCFFRGSMLLAHLPAESANFYSTTVDASGNQVASVEANTTYMASPPPVITTTATTTSVTNGPNDHTFTDTYDDGQMQYTQVRHVVNGTLVSRDFRENLLVATGGSDELNYKVLAATAGIRWEF